MFASRAPIWLPVGHPKMQEFRLEPRRIEEFIAFLKSLEQ
jgi:hypothetical protein